MATRMLIRCRERCEFGSPASNTLALTNQIVAGIWKYASYGPKKVNFYPIN